MRINICIDIVPTPSANSPSLVEEAMKLIGAFTTGVKGPEILSKLFGGLFSSVRPHPTGQCDYLSPLSDKRCDRSAGHGGPHNRIGDDGSVAESWETPGYHADEVKA